MGFTIDNIDAYLKSRKSEVIALTLGVFLALFFKTLIWIGIIAYLASKLYKFEKSRKARKAAEKIATGETA